MSTPASPTPERRVGALELPSDTTTEVVALLSAAAGPVTDDELADETTAVAAFLAQRAEPSMPRRRLPVRSIRVAAATLVTSVVLGGGLAAADVLPAPAQRWVSKALDVIGIQVPSPGSADSVDAAASTPWHEPSSVAVPSPVSPSGLPSPDGRLVAAGGAARTDGTAAPGGAHAPAAAAGADGPGQPGSGGSGSGSGNAATTHGSSSSSGEGGNENGQGPATDSSGADASGTRGGPRGRGSSGNPPHGNKNAGKQPAASPSSAHGKPTDPGNPVAAHLAAPGQVKKSAGQGQSDTAASQNPDDPVGNAGNGTDSYTGSPTGTG